MGINLPDDLKVDWDGYPDDKILDQISNAYIVEQGAKWMIETFPKLASSIPYAVCDITDGVDVLGNPVKRLEFHTQGWSGCESFINAVLSNSLLNILYYESWQRGGHYTFCVPSRDINK